MENIPDNMINPDEIHQINPIIHSIAVSLGNINLLSQKAQKWFEREIGYYNHLVDDYGNTIVITETMRYGEYSNGGQGPDPIEELWELYIIFITAEGEHVVDYRDTYKHIIGDNHRSGYRSDN